MGWNRKAPFREGSLVNYPSHRKHPETGRPCYWLWDAKEKISKPVEYEWRDADEPMTLKLSYDGFSRGRSSALLHWKDSEGRQWPMFLADLGPVIATAVNGVVEGEFVVTKKGKNYAIKLRKATT